MSEPYRDEYHKMIGRYLVAASRTDKSEAALAERDARIKELEDHIAKLEQLARDLDAKLTACEEKLC